MPVLFCNRADEEFGCSAGEGLGFWEVSRSLMGGFEDPILSFSVGCGGSFTNLLASAKRSLKKA